MKRFVNFIMLALIVSAFGCGNAKRGSDLVLIKTEYGDIKVKLYDDTPKHKANFLKLVKEGFYDDLLFHRVIDGFMIQGGDPDSKNAESGARLGNGSPGYTIDAEIMPEKHFHKKGALAAARKGGPSNPDKKSSGSQFYIVQGTVATPAWLKKQEKMIAEQQKNKMLQERYAAAKEELQQFNKNNDPMGLNMKIAQIREEVDSIYAASGGFKFTDEQIEAYSTIGGYPSLDGEYTVFGEVVEGLDVIDKIAAVETDKNNRPLKDVKMEMELVK